MNTRSFLTLSVALAATASQAITFNVLSYGGAPFSNGASSIVSGNAISFTYPNALVGDAATVYAGLLQITYDVDSGAGNLIDKVGANLGVITAGSGNVNFIEQVFALDSNFNEIGGAIGSMNQNFAPAATYSYSNTVSFVPSQRIRVKKTFTLTSTNTAAFDMAAVAINNQFVNVVPEPGSFLALGLGAAFLLRRKK